jgi:hypothetical protein
MASAWEVIKDDASIPAAIKQSLQADARSILAGLMVKHASLAGTVDLELWDPDGRRTYHGNLHESSLDRVYIPFSKTGPASMMALGEVAGLVYVSDTQAARTYLQSLIAPRGLAREAASGSMSVIALAGDQTNHSSYNMLFLTGYLAGRYVEDPAARKDIAQSVQGKIYLQGVGASQPATWGQAFYDLVYSASTGGAEVGKILSKNLDAASLARTITTLRNFRDAPFFGTAVTNCDASEVAAGSCTLSDGTVVGVRTAQGSVVADRAIPMQLRPPSNYYWRSNPFEVNGDWGENNLFPGSDFRLVYWMGRYLQRAP